MEQLATFKSEVAEPQSRAKGRLHKEGLKSMAVSYVRRHLSVAAVKAQCLSLLGRIEVMGPGTNMLVERRRQALLLDEQWRRESAAHSWAEKLGYSMARKGFPRKSI